MAKPHVTIIGNVGNVPIQRTTTTGTPVTLFSVAQHHWRPGPRNSWQDAGTSWYDVVCRWGWSENVAKSLGKGDPVVVTGKLRINERISEQGVVERVTAEIDAISVGHDLRRGISTFEKVERARSQMPNDESEISEMLEGSRSSDVDPFVSSSAGAENGAQTETPGERTSDERTGDASQGDGDPFADEGGVLQPV